MKNASMIPGAKRVVSTGLGIGVLTAAVLGLGAWSGAEESAEARVATHVVNAAPPAQAADGKKIYNTLCAACHQTSGKGIAGTFPPIAGSEWVTGDKTQLIKVVLHGLTGEIGVAGEVYNSTMSPFGSTLKDAEIAAVATYIRTNFGNKASPVTVAEVARVRAANKARTKPWTAKELVAGGEK